jgi:acetylglutamate kinase
MTMDTLPTRARDAQAKARVLREALPWITRWAGRTVVVKYGGSVAGEFGTFAHDVALLHRVGLRVVVVHGGGPQISDLSTRLGLQARFVAGRRVTDEATLEVVKMVLLGQVNPALVGAISGAGATAVGVSGTDGTLLRVTPADPQLGRVGDVAHVNPHVLRTLLDEGAIPVVAPLGRGPDRREYNVNADAVAGAIAAALHADKLLYLTNVAGLYEDFGAEGGGTLLASVTLPRLRELLDSGALNDGMVPKVASVVDALDEGVRQAHLLDGRVEHALLLEIFTDEGVGTMIDRGVRP